MKILLLTLPFSRDPIKNGKRRTKIKRGLLPPLGVGYLASVLREDENEIKIIDPQVSDFGAENVIEEIQKFSPDAVGISYMTPNEKEALELVEAIKEKTENTLVILGGPHPTTFPQETMEETEAVDVLIVGEAEYVMRDIVRCFKNGNDLSKVNGVLYRDQHGKIQRTPKNEKIVDLETLPPPAWDLFDLASYAPEPFENKRLPSTSFLVSRGCTYSKCTFCHRTGKGKRAYRTQSVKKTIRELHHLVKNYGMKEIIFYDDDLASDKKWMHDFCDQLMKENFSFIWSFRGRSSMFDYEILKKAKDAGCFSIAIGFESGNQDLLDNIQKGITLEDSLQVARWAHSLDIEIVGTFMLALPGETPEKAEKTIDFAIELDCTYAAFIPTHPFEGTPLYEQCLREGELVLNPYTEDMVQTRYIPQVAYVPKGYESSKQVAAMVKRAYRKFYFRPNYYMKHLRKIKSFEDIQRYWRGFTFLLGVGR